jgi:hypothetical protein
MMVAVGHLDYFGYLDFGQKKAAENQRPFNHYIAIVGAQKRTRTSTPCGVRT